MAWCGEAVIAKSEATRQSSAASEAQLDGFAPLATTVDACTEVMFMLCSMHDAKPCQQRGEE
jgi:hypothetical protein